MECEKCGSEFEPRRAGQRFCSRACQNMNLSRKKRKRNESERNRENMGKLTLFLSARTENGQV